LLRTTAWTWDWSLVTTTDMTGKWAFALDPAGSNVEVSYRVLSNGNLHAKSNSYVAGTKMIVDPSGQFAIAVNAIGPLDAEQGPGKIYVYAIGDYYGEMTAVAGPYATTNSARDLAMDDAGRFLFVANGGVVSVFAFNHQDGTLTEVPFSPVKVGTSSAPRATAIAIASQHN